jgi:uroporphyrinogen decarboxylase
MMKIFNTYMELAMQFVDDVCRLPIEAVWVGDDWADQRGPLFGLERWQKMIKPLFRQLYDHIHSKGKLVITHVCGSLRPFIPDLIDIGQDVFDTVQPEAAGMDPYQLKKDFGKYVSFWGCLGNQSAVTFYTPEKLRDEIKKLKELMSVGGGHILAPSKGLNKTVPLENLEVIIDEFEHNRAG